MNERKKIRKLFNEGLVDLIMDIQKAYPPEGVDELQKKIRELEQQIVLKDDRLSRIMERQPYWEMGFSSDSLAAQTLTDALTSLHRIMGVSDQTAAVSKLKELIQREGERDNDTH